MKNPIEIAVRNLNGSSVVAELFGIKRQAVNQWIVQGKLPLCNVRVLAALSGVAVDDFLKWEELRKGVDYAPLLRSMLSHKKKIDARPA